MKGRVVVLFLGSALAALAQTAGYVWDYTGQGPSPPFYYGFVVNGDLTFGSASGGSAMWPATVSGINPNDYEISTSLMPTAGGGTYMHFLRAAPTTVLPGTGNYISVELAVPLGWQAGGAVPLAIKQCLNGTVTQLAGTSVPLHNGDVMRSVVWGTTLWVFINNVLSAGWIIPQTTGQPGYGGYNIPAGSGFSHPTFPAAGSIRIGHHDTAPPLGVIGTSVATSLLPYSASLKWQGVADDPAGIGVFAYRIWRNGTAMTTVFEPEFTDATVQPSTTYTYSVQAVDFHGNGGAAATITLTTPPPAAIDPRRTGIYSTGSYWGGGGEQIDTLSGNLNFSIPLLTAQARTGWTVPVSLVYDSQNWRQDNGVNWKLGNDVGYGFGWKMLIGSITPYYTDQWSGVDHYVYTDSSGAEYRLDQNTGGVWTSSSQSVYVWLDTNASPSKLHFRDGKFWVLGCTSGGTEADAGTMYPTIIEDTFGNQVIVTYDTGVGLPFSQTPNPSYGYLWSVTQNTSSRIVSIEDARATSCYPQLAPAARMPCSTNATGSTIVLSTFGFGYDRSSAIPHLAGYANSIAMSGLGTFSIPPGRRARRSDRIRITAGLQPGFSPAPRSETTWGLTSLHTTRPARAN